MGSQFEKPDVHANVSMLLDQVAPREFEVAINCSFPLAKAAAAHAHADGGAIFGRVILVP